MARRTRLVGLIALRGTLLNVNDADDALGRILGEVGKVNTAIGSVKAELADMRLQQDARHIANANALLEVRQTAQRAMEHATDAKRIADMSAYDTRELHRSVIENTKGFSSKQADQTTQIDGLSKSLTTLVDAEKAREAKEAVLEELDAARWKFIDRSIKIGGPTVAAILFLGGYLLTHWKP
jgi:hypothetical protein